MATASPFKVTAPKAGGNGAFELPPADNHTAALVAVIHLGTQRNDYGGKVTWRPEVFLVWELIGVEMTGYKGKNFLIGERFNLSFNEKAKLRLLVEGWSGLQFKEGEPFDVASLLGKKCMLSVKHRTNDSGKTFANIASVTRPHKSVQIPDPQNTPAQWYIGCGDDLPDWLPKIYGREVAEVVGESKEMSGGNGVAVGGSGAPAGDEEIPF